MVIQAVVIQAVVKQAVGAHNSDCVFMLAQHNKAPLKYLHICAYVQIFMDDKIRIARPCPTAESARGIQPAVTGLSAMWLQDARECYVSM